MRFPLSGIRLVAVLAGAAVLAVLLLGLPTQNDKNTSAHAAPDPGIADGQAEAQAGTSGAPALLVPQFTAKPVPPTPEQLAASEAALARSGGHGPAGVGEGA